MPPALQPAPVPPKRIQLPRNSTRVQRQYVYIKIIESIKPEAWGAVAFDGKILAPGAVVDLDPLPRPLVVIECIGPLGIHQRGKHRDYGYILWRYDFSLFEWQEIARAQAKDWSWTVAMKEPALRALHPRPELVDIVKRSRDLVDELLVSIDQKLVLEKPDVRKTVLDSLYERVAGRIADCA
jgi:hypothetical protein